MEEEKQFLYHLDGLIEGEYVFIKTDSKKVIQKITELMDE